MHSRFISDHLPLPLAGEGRGEGKPLKLAFVLFALLVGGCSMSKWTVPGLPQPPASTIMIMGPRRRIGS